MPQHEAMAIHCHGPPASVTRCERTWNRLVYGNRVRVMVGRASRYQTTWRHASPRRGWRPCPDSAYSAVRPGPSSLVAPASMAWWACSAALSTATRPRVREGCTAARLACTHGHSVTRLTQSLSTPPWLSHGATPNHLGKATTWCTSSNGASASPVSPGSLAWCMAATGRLPRRRLLPVTRSPRWTTFSRLLLLLGTWDRWTK